MAQPQPPTIQKRLDLQEILESLMDEGNAGNVYFQPPDGFQMNYPAIVYKRDDAETSYADNLPWSHSKRYQVEVIDRDPDSLIPDRIRDLPMCRFVRNFTTEGLTHDVFNLYY